MKPKSVTDGGWRGPTVAPAEVVGESVRKLRRQWSGGGRRGCGHRFVSRPGRCVTSHYVATSGPSGQIDAVHLTLIELPISAALQL